VSLEEGKRGGRPKGGKNKQRGRREKKEERRAEDTGLRKRERGKVTDARK